jgi:ubiquinone/menaquinone biosynthesis C-methylase UbiE
VAWFSADLYDYVVRGSERACLGAWREALIAPLSGSILEIGAGTGLNLAHYSRKVDRLVLCEPDPHMRRGLQRRRDRAEGQRIEVSEAGAETLPFESASFDAVVSTLVLCSVHDVKAALGEARRVLKPGGRLIFLEHVAAAPGSERRTWQRRLEPVWKRVAGNCHLCRETEHDIVNAGFRLESIRRESIRKALPILRPSIRGIATKS